MSGEMTLSEAALNTGVSSKTAGAVRVLVVALFGLLSELGRCLKLNCLIACADGMETVEKGCAVRQLFMTVVFIQRLRGLILAFV